MLQTGRTIDKFSCRNKLLPLTRRLQSESLVNSEYNFQTFSSFFKLKTIPPPPASPHSQEQFYKEILS